MTCTDTRAELVDYHFGEIDGVQRERIEAHLLGCQECLRELFAVKRSVETADLAARPSDTARARLRAAVNAEVNPEPVSRAWSWWERPAAFAVAGASVVAALFFLHLVSSGGGAEPRSLSDAPAVVDSPSP